MTETLHTKIALRRPPWRVGIPAPLYLLCPCGREHPQPEVRVDCACGLSWNRSGWRLPPEGRC